MLKKIKNVSKILGGIIAAIMTMAAYIFIKQKQNEKIDEKIDDVEKEIIKNQAVIDYNDKNIYALDKDEAKIKDKIEDIKKEKNEDGLKDFFDNRGF